MELALEVLDLPTRERQSIAEGALIRMGLAEFMAAYPGELSGGMRQRVAMARAFAADPQLLLADEAFSHLDAVTAGRLRKDFLSSARRRGMTVALVTHQLEDAVEAGGRILVFGKPGRLLADILPDSYPKSSEAELQQKLRDLLDTEDRPSATSN